LLNVDHRAGIDANQFKAAFEDAQKTNESRKAGGGAKEEDGDDKTKEVCTIFFPSDLVSCAAGGRYRGADALWRVRGTDRVKVGFYQDR
jgi:hypothetical protein